jgi:3alpha(or 20beta)-hydroxysteroid dehydrogenase
MTKVPGALEDEVAIVTGAASGMGAATARRFIEENAKVVLTDINVEDGATLAAELGENALFLPLDVANAEQWRDVVNQAQSHFGSVTVLMNNAGVGATGYIESYSQATWDRGIAIMLAGPLYGMSAVAPAMRAAGHGSIINVSSLQGREADVGLAPYVAAKFGLRGLSKSAAVELGRYGIRSNTIFPGLVMTSMTRGLPDHLMGRIPLHRPESEDRAGRPEDVAALAAFLASRRASNITGAEITIDGGKSVRFPTKFQDYTAEIAKFKGIVENA